MDFKKAFKMEDFTKDYDEKDRSDNLIFALLAYFGILVLVPIFATQSKYAKFHADQGLKILALDLVLGVVVFVVMFISTLLATITGSVLLGILTALIGIVCSLLSLVILVLNIMGIVFVIQKKAKKVPVVSAITYTIIK